MAQPAPDPRPEPQRLRISRRTYTEDSDPLVDVLLLLYDWSVERRRRAAMRVDPQPPTEQGE